MRAINPHLLNHISCEGVCHARPYLFTLETGRVHFPVWTHSVHSPEGAVLHAEDVHFVNGPECRPDVLDRKNILPVDSIPSVDIVVIWFHQLAGPEVPVSCRLVRHDAVAIHLVAAVVVVVTACRETRT